MRMSIANWLLTLNDIYNSESTIGYVRCLGFYTQQINGIEQDVACVEVLIGLDVIKHFTLAKRPDEEFWRIYKCVTNELERK